MKICLVIANYYPKISKDLMDGALKVIKEKGKIKYKIIYVPGIFEVPVIISKHINSFNAFIALGCVIKGKTPHFDFISRASINSLMYLSVLHKKPIGNGIITCLNKKQALMRSDVRKKNKGGEAAIACLSVLEILKNEKK